tara:strand:+ start:188 stop:490 length:303 start_codon:yes stop_codon:yes gene_type:complete
MLELKEIKQVKYTDIDVEQGIEKDTQENIELEDIPEATQVEEQEAVEISQNENNERIFNNMLQNEREKFKTCVKVFCILSLIFTIFVIGDVIFGMHKTEN